MGLLPQAFRSPRVIRSCRLYFRIKLPPILRLRCLPSLVQGQFIGQKPAFLPRDLREVDGEYIVDRDICASVDCLLRHGIFEPDVEAVQAPLVDVHVVLRPDLEKLPTEVLREWSVFVHYGDGLAEAGHDEPDSLVIVSAWPTEGPIENMIPTSGLAGEEEFEITACAH